MNNVILAGVTPEGQFEGIRGICQILFFVFLLYILMIFLSNKRKYEKTIQLIKEKELIPLIGALFFTTGIILWGLALINFLPIVENLITLTIFAFIGLILIISGIFIQKKNIG